MENSKLSIKDGKSLTVRIPVTFDPPEQNYDNEKSCDVGESYKESSDKIRGLVQKMIDMRKDEKEKDEAMEQKFADLRKRIDSSVSFLESTKTQIENINFMFQRDKLKLANKHNFGDCLNNSNQSLQELDMQMEQIQKKLNTVRNKIGNEEKHSYKKHSENRNFEETLEETVGTLENISCGNYKLEN